MNEYLDLAFHGKQPQMPGLNVTIVRDLGDDVEPIETIPQEIGRVLLNLLDNAFDAVHERSLQDSDAYEPMIEVSSRKVDHRIEIRVMDNGPGIVAASQGRIFEPFYTTKPPGRGTGLGLSLSYDIVTGGHGGTLTVESTEGEGTTFLLTLPVERIS